MLKIKICGIANLEDALFVQECGADFLGFIFYKKSPRYVKPEIVAKIVQKLKSVKTVGVFVNESFEKIMDIKNKVGLDFVQLHGDEDLTFCRQFKKEELIKVIRTCGRGEVGSEELMVNSVNGEVNSWGNYILLDKYKNNAYGGTGETIDWELAKDIKKVFKGKIFLSGGLNCDNILDAIKIVNPYAVDVSSGIEKEAGIKDDAKIREFIRLIREK